MNKRSLIEVNHLTAQYGDQTILEDLSFSIQAGEVFVILGGSGCGKTTLLNHLIGLIEPEQGEIWIEGKNIVTAFGNERASILRNIGVAYQSGALLGSLTLLENVSLPLEELTQYPPEVIKQIAEYKLSLVGLASYGHYLPAEISGGMAKRTAIARAIALNPDILFLDEPSAGLDPVTSAQLDQLILKLSRTLGITFVVVSHELPSIFTIAQRCIMLQNKKIIAEGNPMTLRDHCDNVLVRQFFNRQPELLSTLNKEGK